MFHIRHDRRPRWLRIALASAAMGLAAPALAGSVLVSAAASLTQALQEVGRQYELAHPGHSVVLNFGASGALLQQAARGAPVDMLVAADTQTLDDAQRQGLVAPDGAHMVARNSLVVIVPVGAAVVPKALGDLAGSAFGRIAIGLPASVPAGRYAQSALEAAGQWGAIAPRVVGAANVRQVLDYVARREVDAGFVYATDARVLGDRVTVAFAVSTPQPVLYPAMIMRSAPQPEGARRFLDFLRGPQGQRILLNQGFSAP